MPSIFSRFFALIFRKNKCDRNRNHRIFFNGDIYPRNSAHMELILLPDAIQNGGVFVVSPTTANFIFESLQHIPGYSATKVIPIQFSSFKTIDDFNKVLNPHFKVSLCGEPQEHFSATKNVLVLINDVPDVAFCRHVCMRLKLFSADLFSLKEVNSLVTKDTSANAVSSAVVLLENYHKYLLPGFSLVASQSRALGLSFSYSCSDSCSDEGTLADEFKLAHANCNMYAS